MTSGSAQDPGRCWVIAEVGVNHDGSAGRALQMIDVAADAGADAVKFQTFSSEALVSVHAAKAPYQRDATGGEGGGQLQMLRALELDRPAHFRLKERCEARGVEFLSTPFDLGSLRFLVDELGVGRIKLGSGELTNAPLLVEAGRTGRPIILSTGMGDLAEVERALGAVEWGRRRPEGAPGEGAFGQATPGSGVILLHCTTAYPTPVEDVNLRAMGTLRERFGLPVGLSDHTPGATTALAAVALGAVVIEKHFTLDRAAAGPDHAASLEPAALGELVRGVREVEAAMGDGVKVARACEADNAAVARKSLVALRAIAAGEVFTEENLGVKRPGTGRSPFEYWSVLGIAAGRDYAADELIE